MRVQQLISDDELLNPYEDLIMSGLDSLKIMQFSSELKVHGIQIGYAELIRNPILSSWWLLL